MVNKLFLMVFFSALPAHSPPPKTLALVNDLTKMDKEWLDLVDPIITSEERRIFKKRLKNARKKAEFIDLFWAKRDDDLSDSENRFKESYLSRYDFVMANFDQGNKRPSSAKGQIFLLLGKPDSIETRVDYRLAGLDYRNPYLQFQPELWIYNSVGYDFPRGELRIQFVPVSEFGEYTALTDQLSWHFIRNLKYKFILHRDLKKAPLQTSQSDNYQYESDSELDDSEDGTLESSKQRLPITGIAKAPAPVAKPSEPVQAEQKELPPSPKPEQLVKTPPQNNTKETQSTTSVPEEKGFSTEKNSGNHQESVVEVESAKGLKDADIQKESSSLVVPKGPEIDSSPSAFTFLPQAENQNQLSSELAFFTRDPNQSLLIGRLGVPMSGLDFQFNGKNYETSFVLTYRLTDSFGRVFLQEKVPNKMSVPQQSITLSETVYYSREFTLLVPPGRYLLETQIELSSKNQISYSKAVVDVLPITNSLTSASPLVFLDPHISENQTQVQVGGKPFGLNLATKLPEGEPLYPLIELTGSISDEALNTIEFLVLRNGEEIVRWGLYPEELTKTAQGTLWVHPILSSQSLDFGLYTLRFEMQVNDGQWVTKDKPFFMR